MTAINKLHLLRDYWRAVRTASGGAWHQVPPSIHSVLRARIAYDIGPRYHSLFDLIHTPEREWPEFIIDNGLKHLLRKLNPPAAREIVNDKLAFMRHCQQHGLPSIPIVAVIDRAQPEDALNGLEIARWQTLLADAPSELFIKLIDGTWGIDAFVAERNGDGRWNYCGRQGDLAELHAFCLQRLRQRRGWIVQPVMKNHPTLARIMSPNALGTVRAVTHLRGDEAELLFAVLRIPVGKNRADNFSHGASGNLVADLDPATGTLKMPRASRDTAWPDMADVSHHPDTGERIPGFELPFWPELKELVLEAQRTLPALCTLGWDIGVTASGPMIVEANATYDVDLIQVAQRRGLRSILLKQRLEQESISSRRTEQPAQAPDQKPPRSS